MSVAIVAGALANKPGNGGEAWVRLSWALGLRALGFDVHLIEEISPHTCMDAHGRPTAAEDSFNLAYFAAVTTAFDLGATLLCDGHAISGTPARELHQLAAASDLLLNISGHLRDTALLAAPRCRVFLDIDPGFTQAWHRGGELGEHLEAHDIFATIGERIGSDACGIPRSGIDWIPTRQPVVLAEWPVATAAVERQFSTVARWRSPYGAVSAAGGEYPLKHHEFRRVVGLPQLVHGDFELALDIDAADGADRALLRASGWHVVDAAAVADTPAAYHRYVQASGAEFSACHGVYAHTASGWISDRSVRYLASGRPAVVQDTAPVVPTGAGLLTWASLEEAQHAVERVTREYEAHATAARRLAETHFDSNLVIGELLDRCRVAA